MTLEPSSSFIHMLMCQQRSFSITVSMRLLAALILIVPVLTSPSLAHSETNLREWERFKSTHARTYGSTQEEARRFQAFCNNLVFIREHNAEYEAGRSTYRLGVTPFADLTNAEYQQLLTSSRQRQLNMSTAARQERRSTGPDPPPASFDWRQQVPIHIRDQGQLGDATVIATTSALQAGYYLSDGQSVTLSTQQLRDCVSFPSVLDELQFVRQHGIADAAAYPAQAGTGPCRDDVAVCATLDAVLQVTDGDETALRDALLHSPATVEIDASHLSFQLYSSGVYDEPRCSAVNIDHAVLLVGYGSAQTLDFWTLANSWGTSWGEGGYMRLRRGVNRCGVATYAGVPVGVHPA